MYIRRTHRIAIGIAVVLAVAAGLVWCRRGRGPAVVSAGLVAVAVVGTGYGLAIALRIARELGVGVFAVQPAQREAARQTLMDSGAADGGQE